MIDTLLLVLILAVALGIGWILLFGNRFRLVVKRYAVTLKGGDGEFVGLLTEKAGARMTFENCTIPATEPGTAPLTVPGRIHVPRRNIAYMQELPEGER